MGHSLFSTHVWTNVFARKRKSDSSDLVEALWFTIYIFFEVTEVKVRERIMFTVLFCLGMDRVNSWCLLVRGGIAGNLSLNVLTPRQNTDENEETSAVLRIHEI